MKSRVEIIDEKWDEKFQRLELEMIINQITDKAIELITCRFPVGAFVSFFMIDESTSLQINLERRAKNKGGNVISFAFFSPSENWREWDFMPELCIGEVFLAREIIEDESIRYGKSFKERTVHMACHGLLHVLGMDHQEKKDRESMEIIEKKIMFSFGFNDPYFF